MTANPKDYYPQAAYYAPGWQAPRPPRDRRRTRRVLLLVAALVGALVLAGGVVGARFWLDTRPLGPVESPRTATARQLTPGHCLADLPPDGAVDRVSVVPCDQPHAAEVLGELLLLDAFWPGRQAVDERVGAACEMDNAQLDAGFAPVVWAPSETGWRQGDRRGLCLAWFDGGGVTGSFVAGQDVSTP